MKYKGKNFLQQLQASFYFVFDFRNRAHVCVQRMNLGIGQSYIGLHRKAESRAVGDNTTSDSISKLFFRPYSVTVCFIGSDIERENLLLSIRGAERLICSSNESQ